MGQVLRAVDRMLGEEVALKTLRREHAASKEWIERLARELKLGRQIRHANVCRVFELGNAEGHWFITMELAEGGTLRDLLETNPPRSFDERLEDARAVVDGLAAIHAVGIVHRDVTPRNVLRMTDGRLVVSDFGLALHHDQTTTSFVAGTPAYAPPELYKGAKPAPSSDVWQVGIVMHEILFGARPQWDSHRPGSPPVSPVGPDARDLEKQMAALCLACMDDDPAARPADAGEVARRMADPAAVRTLGSPPRAAWAARRRWWALVAMLGAAAILLVGFAVQLSPMGGPRGAIDSLAVLPLVNASGNAEMDYLSDGITDSVINNLAQLPQLKRVIARSTVSTYKGKEVDPRQVGQELKVSAVLTGSMTQRGADLIIGAELVNARDGSRLWGEQYDRKFVDLIEVQVELARQISEKLRLALTGEDERRLARRHTGNTEAYRLYLKGRHYFGKYNEDGFNKAIEHFRQAIDLDPNYAPAWAGLADSYYGLSNLYLPPKEVIPKSRKAAERALELDETLAEAHTSLGVIKAQYDWDRAGAQNEFRRAIELNRNEPQAHQWLGILYYQDGQFDAALVELRRAQDLDPLSAMITVAATWPLWAKGQYDQAIKENQKAIDLDPKFGGGGVGLTAVSHMLRAEDYLRKGRQDEAVAELLRHKASRGASPETLAALERAYEVSGMEGYWQAELELGIEQYQTELASAANAGKGMYVSPFRLAGLHARVGNKDQAFALLEQCFENRDENLLWLKAESMRIVNPWGSIQSDPRFLDLLRRMNLAP